MALGTLIIQERCQLSDRETVIQISENPYFQYFIGLAGFQNEEPRHHSLLTHFRKRLTPAVLGQVNEWSGLRLQLQRKLKNKKIEITTPTSVEMYKTRFGYYPKEILAGQIYRNRENMAFCKANGIRISGQKLGRPSKVDTCWNKNASHTKIPYW